MPKDAVLPTRRTKRTVRALAVAGCCALALVAGSRPCAADSLRIGGTGSALANLAKLAKMFAEYQADLVPETMPSLGSSGGIRAVLAGAIDVGVSARPLKDEEKAKGAVGAAYARTPLLFVSKHDTRGNGFSRAELAAMYAGTTTTWPNRTPLRIVIRPAAESDTKLLRTLSPEMNAAVDLAHARPGVIETLNDEENAEALLQTFAALGTISLGQMVSENLPLHRLKVDGVAGDLSSVADGRYPLVKTMYLVTRADPTATAHRFVAFVLSPAADGMLTDGGFLPLADRKE